MSQPLHDLPPRDHFRSPLLVLQTDTWQDKMVDFIRTRQLYSLGQAEQNADIR